MEENKIHTSFKSDFICRICLLTSEDMQALFEENGIIQQIEYCTGLLLSPEPNLPSHICGSCLAHLRTAHTFKSTCLTSHYSLHSHTQHTDTILDRSATVTVKVEQEESKEIDLDGSDTGDSWGKEVRRSKRVKMKKESKDSPPNVKPVYTRGPYKTQPRPPRRPKFKFRRLFCAPCQLQFRSKKEADAHRADAHPGKDSEVWVCEICGKVFAHRGSHYSHVMSHKSPRHGCPQCDYRTNYRHDLVKHLRIHAGVKQYQCAVCARAFHTSSNLASHTRRLHERARPFACAQCPRRFFDRTKLARHLDSHLELKRFECEVCHSCFTRRCYWKKHLLKQHGVAVPAQRPGRQRVNFLVEKATVEAPKGAKTEVIDGEDGIDKSTEIGAVELS